MLIDGVFELGKGGCYGIIGEDDVAHTAETSCKFDVVDNFRGTHSAYLPRADESSIGMLRPVGEHLVKIWFCAAVCPVYLRANEIERADLHHGLGILMTACVTILEAGGISRISILFIQSERGGTDFDMRFD